MTQQPKTAQATSNQPSLDRRLPVYAFAPLDLDSWSFLASLLLAERLPTRDRPARKAARAAGPAAAPAAIARRGEPA